MNGPVSSLGPRGAVAVVVARDGRLPLGADAATDAAGGAVLVVGSGAADAVGGLPTSGPRWWADPGTAHGAGWWAAALAPVLVDVGLVVLPASPDGRDLAPRLAAVLDRTLLAGATRLETDVARSGADGPVGVEAELARLDDRVVVPVRVDGPAVATLWLSGAPVAGAPSGTDGAPPTEVRLTAPGAVPDAVTTSLVAPDPRTMDLADASFVVAGGAGLAAGQDDAGARATFDLLASVAAALGASAGATRVATDAGWTDHDRQIGTTGVMVRPDVYVALGVAGASQHVGGIGHPDAVASVNTDPSCPMTTMADLGLVADARALLVELARRLDVAVPTGVGTTTPGHEGATGG